MARNPTNELLEYLITSDKAVPRADVDALVALATIVVNQMGAGSRDFDLAVVLAYEYLGDIRADLGRLPVTGTAEIVQSSHL